MSRTLNAALIALAVMITSLSLHARDCSESKPFTLAKPQVIQGSFQDSYGAVLPGIKVQLLSEKKVIRDLRTDNLGRYDFGEVAPGKYRIRVEYSGKAFCAPKIRCSDGECRINPSLDLNPKNFVRVE